MDHGCNRPICRRIRAMRHAGLILAALVTVSSPLLAQAPLAISNTSLPFGGVGQQYSVDVKASGGSGSYSFSIVGSLPPGLMLSMPVGEAFIPPSINGQPTTPGTYSFTLTVTDNQTSNTASKVLSIGIMQIST